MTSSAALRHRRTSEDVSGHFPPMEAADLITDKPRRSLYAWETSHMITTGSAIIRERKPVPTLRDYIDNDFAPFVESRSYAHPQADTIKAAIEKARGGHRIGHSKTAGSVKLSAVK